MLLYNTVDPRLSKPHLSESSFMRTHKFGGEYHYMFEPHYVVMNIVNVVCYLNYLNVHVIHLSKQIFKARGHRGSDKRQSTLVTLP